MGLDRKPFMVNDRFTELEECFVVVIVVFLYFLPSLFYF